MANYSGDYLRRLQDAVERFETAFESWMETQNELTSSQSRGLFPTVSTKDGQDKDVVRDRELQVAMTAGPAASAVAVTGAYIVVQGIGPIDPVSYWSLMADPKAVLTPRDIRLTTANVKGRLDAMITDAEQVAEESLPAFSPAQLHTVVWAAAAPHWTVHQYRVAVHEASEALTAHWKQRLSRNDVDATAFWQQTLSSGDPAPGRPKLAWPGEPTDKTVKSMRGGLEPLAKALVNLATGLSLTARNTAAHSRLELTEQEAMERLAAYSYLARLLDKCEIHEVKEPF
ncbi:MAG: TIGR02391 family protein [Bifidobacteriaceae bacterium]|jgi:hypothetical protein|nr:TIGR02391 family protein [Bifidobacteriaceae bacterium]